MTTDLYFNLYNIDYSDRAVNPALKFEITSMTRDGECQDKEAKIKVTGAELGLWELTDWMRLPARIYQLGTPVFRGWIKSVKITASNGLTLSISMQSMYNRVKVTYSNIEDGESVVDDQAETSWYTRTGSSDYYGYREKIINLSEGNSAQAIAMANRALWDYSWPIAEKDLGSLGVNTKPSAEITLAGWFETLDWRYYAQAAGKEAYEDIGVGLQAFGDATARTMLLQRFQLGSVVAWSAVTVKIRVKKEGAPVDNLVVTLATNAGVALATATLAGASVPENLNWVEMALSVKVNLALSTTYQLKVSRSGAVDGSNYYKIDANEALGYARGDFQIYNGSAWVARSPDADMLFSIVGTTETTTQIGQVITSCGQFLAGSAIQSVSGVYTSPFRDGEQTGLAILRELFKSGTTNYRRLQASVDDARRVLIGEEPAEGSADYTVDAGGKIYDPNGNMILAETMPAGVWLALKDLIPAQAQFLGVRNSTRVFVESVTWQAGGKLRWKFRGSGNIISLTGVD